MKFFYLITACLWSLSPLAQEEYFAAENKQQGLLYYQRLLYSGCGKLKQIENDTIKLLADSSCQLKGKLCELVKK